MKIGAKTTISVLALAAGLLGPGLGGQLFAQVDFTGEWAPAYHEDGPERLPGPELGDYLGMPLNDNARQQADSYDADRISVVTEYQCRPHSADYGIRGLGDLRVTREINPITQEMIAFHTYMPAWGSERTIYMDGRPHPGKYASHTWQGFSTGVWDGNMLVVTTTHLKANYLRRNGIASSDQRTLTEYWTRHRNYLTVVEYVDDPVMLSEPLVRSQNWTLDPGQETHISYCEYVPEVPHETGAVPNHLPGTNPFLHEVADWYGIPYEAVRGGAKTIYPEYKLTMTKPENPPPARCERFCVCSVLLDCNLHGGALGGAVPPAPPK
jgi:hypothetical protein